MPQQPTILSNATLTGRTAATPMAGAEAFGSQLGQELQQFGNQLARSTQQVSGALEVRKSLEADKYTNDAMSELSDYYSKLMADPAYNTTEDYADDLQSKMTKSLSDWEAKAPNREARDQFRTQFQRFANRLYSSAAVTSARTKVDNVVLSQEKLSASIVGQYPINRNTPDLDANALIIDNIGNRFASLDSTLGKIAPEKARQMKAQLIEDAAYTTMNDSPDTARKILSMGTELLDGRRIHAIESQIKTAEESIGLKDRSALQEQINNTIASARLNGQPGQISLEYIQSYIPGEKGKALWTQVNAEIDTINTSHQLMDKVKPLNISAQYAAKDKLLEQAKSDPQNKVKNEAVYKAVSQAIEDNRRHMEQDRAGYMLKNIPALKAADDAVTSLEKTNPKDPSLPQKRAERDNMLVLLQSNPAPDVSEEDRQKYHVVNRTQVKVMSNSLAESYVRQIEESSPKERVQTIRNVLAQHPGNEELAFNNLVQLQSGQGLPGKSWLLYKNRDHRDAADLAGAMADMQATTGMAADATSEYDKALKNFVPWKQFATIFPSDNYQRLGIADGIREGVIAYAMAQKNKSPEQAVQESVNKWIFGKMGIATTHGQAMLIDRERENGPDRTDQEIKQLGRDLEEVVKTVNPREIKTTSEDGNSLFPEIFGSGGPKNDNTKLEALMMTIHGKAFYQPAGDLATLYMPSESGTAFELRDHNNQAIAIKLDDVKRVVNEVIDEQTGITFPFPSYNKEKPFIEKKVTAVPVAPDRPEFRSYRGYTTNQTTFMTNWPIADPKMFKVKR